MQEMKTKLVRNVRLLFYIGLMWPLVLAGQVGSGRPDSLTADSKHPTLTGAEAALLQNYHPSDRFVRLIMEFQVARRTEDSNAVKQILQKAVSISPKARSSRERAYLYLIQSSIYYFRRELPAAMQSLHLGDSLASLAGDNALRAECKIQMAELYRLGHTLDKALAFVEEAERLAAGYPPLVVKARVRQISIQHQLHSHDDDTVYLADQARRIASVIDLSTYLLSAPDAAQVRCELGSVQQARNQHALAVATFEQAAAQYRAIGDYPNYCSVQASTFRAKRETVTPVELIRFGKSQLDSCTKYNFHDRDHEFYSGIADAYEALGSYKEALAYKQLNFEARRRIDKRYNQERLLELEALYDATKRKEELGRLASEKTLLKVENHNSRQLVRWLLGGGLIVSMLLIALVFLVIRTIRSNARIKDQAQSLRTQNQLIARNLEEKEFLFRELHHRVKNNLQLLASFLSLQISHHPDQLPKDFLSEVEKKIKAMALVHEQLYRSSEIGQVMLKDYFQDIGDHLLGSLGSVLPDLEIEIQGDEIQVNVDMAIQLGLIFNEMVTNSLKHAYPTDDQDAKITVEISTAESSVASIIMRDNGVGFPTHFDPFGSNRVGTRIIVLLARQLGARLDFYNRQGATWHLQMPISQSFAL